LRRRGFDAGFGEQGELIDFGEVVVFAGQPEDGDVLAASGLGGVLRLADGGGGLEESEEGAAEQSDLLAGDDGGGSVLEAFNISPDGAAAVGENGAGGVEAVGLAEEGVGEAGAVGLVEGGRVVGPGHREGIGGIPGGGGRLDSERRRQRGSRGKSAVVPGSVEMG